MDKISKEHILELVKQYTIENSKKKEFIQGQPIPYAGRIFDHHEVVNLVDSALEFWLTSGRYTKEFEKKLSEYIGTKYALLVNSGSSANLLAFMALTSPLLGERAVKPKDEVITVAAGFPTTVSPIIQFGAVPVFVDVTLEQLNIDVNMLNKCLTPKTKAVMLAHTLGNPFDINSVKKFCNENSLWLIEDNCDALGSEYYGKKTGCFGDIGTSSFYPPHHITTGEGGAVYTNNPLLHKILLSMRDWGRDCSCPSGNDNVCGNRFNNQYGNLPMGYDHKYVYSHFGFNLKATDMQAAIGVAQLDKLEEFVNKRRENFNLLFDILESAKDDFILPSACEGSKPSWFGFFLVCREHIDRKKLVLKLESSGIQTRMLFAGNIVKQPCFSMVNQKDYRIATDLSNTDYIMEKGFWVGVYPGMTSEMIEYIGQQIKNL